jgi:serine/threonine-protein kinase
MAQPTAEKLAQRAFEIGLLDERQLQEVWASLGTRNVRPEELIQFLVRREILTNYQVERLRKGERSGFFYGPYKVQYLVGAGTFARVFRAVHRETGEVVALKVLRARYSDNPTYYGQFIREGHIGCTLRHPNIVRIFEVVSQGHSHFLVMEFVEGQNLREFVKVRRKLDPLVATRLMIDITEGLRYAFEHGLTHRDLKMSNVLVSSHGQAKLVDFGLAALEENLSDDLLAENPNPRAIDYAALERATGVRKDDTRSDIYFLGCIYYHMLTGQSPLLETQDRLQRLSKSRFTSVAPIRQLEPEIPDAVALVVNKAMILDPNRRYQSPSAVLADLRMAMARLTEGTSQPSSSATPSGRTRQARAGPQHTVLVVESSTRLQDVFRQSFKEAGYRVLLTADPSRAVARLRQDASVAECVLINAQHIGEPALRAFNELGEDRKTSFLPAILLLDEEQSDWAAQAKTAEHRIVLHLPLKMRSVHEALARAIEAEVQR